MISYPRKPFGGARRAWIVPLAAAVRCCVLGALSLFLGAAPVTGQETSTAVPDSVKRALAEAGEAWRWRMFGRDEGLPSNSVFALYHQNREFFVYVATDLGVCRYNLWKWSVIENADPFEIGDQARFVESEQVLYLATSRSLWRVQGEILHKAEYDGSGPLRVAANANEAYVIDLGERTLARIRGQRILPETSAGEVPPGRVLDYKLDSSGTHWLVTSEGLYSRKRQRKWFRVEARSLHNDLVDLECERLFRVPYPRQFETPKSTTAAGEELWALFRAGATGGYKLARLRPEEGFWETLCSLSRDLAFGSVLRDRQGNFFATTDDGRLYVSADRCQWVRATNLGLGKVALHAAAVDAAGVLWFRMDAGGAVAFDPGSPRWERITTGSGESIANVLSLCETEGGDVWMGLKNGVVRFDAETGESQLYDGVLELDLRRITGLAEDGIQRVWVSSATAFSGAVYFDKGGDHVVRFTEHRVSKIVRDDRGELWLLPRGEERDGRHILYRLSHQTFYEPKPVSAEHGPVNDILRGEDGVFWIATNKGLVRAALNEAEMRFETERLYTQAEEGGLPLSGVVAIAEGPYGAIWACQPYAGVSRVQNDTVVNFTEKDGLPSSVVYSVVRLGEGLWFGTDRGLAHFSGGCWYHLPVASASEQQSSVSLLLASRSERNSLLLGTFGQGALRYRPQARGRPRFTLRDVPGEVGVGDEVTFRWDARDYRNETLPEDLLFRYRLEGNEWSPFGSHRSYVMKPEREGKYRFEVEVRDLDGNRNRGQDIYRFVALTTASQRVARSLPFIVTVGLLGLAGLVFAVLRHRARRQRRLTRHGSFYRGYPGAVFLLDGGGRVVDYNGVEPSLLGLESASRGDIIGRPLEMLPLFSTAEMRTHLKRLLEGVAFSESLVYPGSDSAAERRVECVGFRERQVRGRVPGAVVVVRDETQQKRRQRLGERDRRFASLRSLSDRVASALQEHLQELDDWRERLGSEAQESPGWRQLEGRIRQLEGLARSLSVFAGRFDDSVPMTAVGAVEVLERVVKESLERAQQNGTPSAGSLRLDFRVQTGLWPVRAQLQPFADALYEILKNAWESLPHGGAVKVRGTNIRLDDDPGMLPSGSYVEITVEDSGVGMEDTQLEKVFEPFYSTKPRDRSLGVGLSLAFGVVRGHGGDLRVESRAGKGTTVRVLWPAARGGE
jgi:signal transduction histidine kinase/ligand-binding sensor domain-containing protein